MRREEGKGSYRRALLSASAGGPGPSIEKMSYTILSKYEKSNGDAYVTVSTNCPENVLRSSDHSRHRSRRRRATMDCFGLVTRRVWFNRRRSYPPNLSRISRRRRGFVRPRIRTSIPICGDDYPMDGPRDVSITVGG